MIIVLEPGLKSPETDNCIIVNPGDCLLL